jgi:hypothetical protein
MRSCVFILALVLGGVSGAQGKVLIKVDQSSQSMKVVVDDVPTFNWRVSTGKPGFDTPNGTFRPNRLDADHHSDEYDGAPMPYAIFFDLNGHAIHGTYEKIGKPGASHGCVRLTPENARTLFTLVEKAGLSNVSVNIGGDVMVAMAGQKATSSRTRVSQRVRDRRAVRSADDNLMLYPDDQMFERPTPRGLYGLDRSQARDAPRIYPGALY